MYHEEKVIDGVLCWRGTPNAEFQPYTLLALTTAFIAMKSAYERECFLSADLRDRLRLTKRAIDGWVTL